MTTNAENPGPTPDITTATTRPYLAVVPDQPPADLQTEIERRRLDIVARLAALKSDERVESTEEQDKLKKKLSELSFLIKQNVVDGWANLGGNAKIKLAHWLGQ